MNHLTPRVSVIIPTFNRAQTIGRAIRSVLVQDFLALEIYLYLCDKHSLPGYVKVPYENNWRRGSLKLAFFEKRLGLAESVKKQYPELSLKDWVWYWGAKCC